MNQQSTPNYTLYPGKFVCHTCKEIVPKARMYVEKGDLTWMCTKKHISKVTFPQKGY